MISKMKIAAQSYIKLAGGRIQFGMLGVAAPYDSQSCCMLFGCLRSKCTMLPFRFAGLSSMRIVIKRKQRLQTFA